MADRWDAVELWVTGLPFLAQVVLALAIVVPVCAAVSRGLDVIVTRVVNGRSAPKGSHRRRRGG